LHSKKPTNQTNQRNFAYEETPVKLMKPALMNRPIEDWKIKREKDRIVGSIFKMVRKPIHKTKICSTFRNYKVISFTKQRLLEVEGLKLKFRACP